MRAPDAAWVLGILLVIGCGTAEDPLARGDALWADSSYEEALAEYRLAARRSRGDAAVRLRLAHAYVQVGRAERARESYAGLLRDAPEHEDQAVYDLLRLAYDSRLRGEGQALATAAAGVLAWRGEQPLPGLQQLLARQALEAGDRERGLFFLQSALADAPPDSLPALLLLAGRLREDLGACDAATRFYRRFLEIAPVGTQAEDVRWRLGNCAYTSARRYAQAGMPMEALARYAVVEELGVPLNLVDQAAFERGELFRSMGAGDSARAAYGRVVQHGTGRAAPALLNRAAVRLRELGFPEYFLPGVPLDPDTSVGVASFS